MVTDNVYRQTRERFKRLQGWQVYKNYTSDHQHECLAGFANKITKSLHVAQTRMEGRQV